MNYNIISTGSQGNAVIIDGKIMIDCGVPWKMVRPFSRKLQLVLLTHEHGDHFRPSTVKKLSCERPGIRWGCCRWMVDLLLEAGINEKQIDVLEIGEDYCYSNLIRVTPEKLSHNVPNCGYHIQIDGEYMFYATDTGNLDGVQAKGYDLYMIEANHSREEILARIRAKSSSGVYAYEMDVIRNHLSVEQANDFIYRNAKPTSEYVYLHQHRER